MTKGAVIVETRLIPNMECIIEKHMSFLPPDWGLTIFHSPLNETILKGCFPTANFVNLGFNFMTEHQYNDLLTSAEFWNKLPYDKVLVFQTDSMLLREGIEEFLKWDYVGAPWKFQLHGGNGGLSLRTKSVMLDIISRFKFLRGYYGNEDIYFSNFILKSSHKIAPRSVCSKFSCETIFELGTLGYHAIEKHLTIEQVNQIKHQYDNTREVHGTL